MKIRRKSRKYRAPRAQVVGMTLESNFCFSVIANMQADELENVNANASYADPESDNFEAFYFDQF